MIDHTGFQVTDIARSTEFYTKALAPLNYTMLVSFEIYRGFGETKPDFWIHQGAPTDKIDLCFRAASRTQVKAFHAAAIAAGGTDNGAPGVRPHYHEHYFGAFVRDPDGHNIEAVCHEPYLG